MSSCFEMHYENANVSTNSQSHLDYFFFSAPNTVKITISKKSLLKSTFALQDYANKHQKLIRFFDKANYDSNFTWFYAFFVLIFLTLFSCISLSYSIEGDQSVILVNLVLTNRK